MDSTITYSCLHDSSHKCCCGVAKKVKYVSGSIMRETKRFLKSGKFKDINDNPEKNTVTSLPDVINEAIQTTSSSSASKQTQEFLSEVKIGNNSEVKTSNMVSNSTKQHKDGEVQIIPYHLCEPKTNNSVRSKFHIGPGGIFKRSKNDSVSNKVCLVNSNVKYKRL